MQFLQQKALRGLASPSNVAMATLVAFLSVGYVTDWKMLRGQPSQSAMAVTPGLSEHSSSSLPPRLRTVRSHKGRTIYLQATPRSEVADRRAANHDAKESPEID
jgi:hypothetical protein